MLIKRYSEFIEISPTFESVVDIDADTRNSNLWKEYIVGDDMVKMMEVLCQSLNNEGPDLRRSFWIEGTYGTGKSYAAIFIKHLLEEKPGVIDTFLSQNSRLAAFRNRFMKCRAADKGDYLVIWKTGCTGIRDGNAILMEAEKAVRDALAEKFGDKADYAEASLKDAVVEQINNPVINWENVIDSTELGDDYSSVEELREAVVAGELKALQRTAAVIRRYNWGLVDSLDTFKKWIGSVIANNGLAKSGIFFLWDEFTEYVANSDDQTILQQLSEFCKVQPFFMLFVVHRTSDMVERITPERYQLITHRFHQVVFHISTDAAFDLIAGSINIRNGMGAHWNDERKAVIKNIKPFLPDMAGLDDKISEQIEHLCPMHPMTIKLLSRVAENYAASQRTMFRFMKDKSTIDQGFVGYINKYGPEDQACWLTPDWLWDYFFTRESDFSDKDTKAAEYIRHYEESKHLVENDENAFRVFKTAMLLLALMSSTKGIYSGRKSKDGIAATQECLETCLAGVIAKEKVKDFLSTMNESKILVLDEDARGNVRIQLPFRGAGDVDFKVKLQANDKKYSRYMMFSKDGIFAQEFEKTAWDENDACQKRMKVAVCCAETNSINARLTEIKKELDKSPYKIGLLIVTVATDSQAISIQTSIQEKAKLEDNPRLVFAILKTPLTDENRNKWLTTITKQEMAGDAGQTGSVNQYKLEANKIVTSWISSAISIGKMIAYYKEQIFNNINGMSDLRNRIRNNVQDVVFPYAPENIVVTKTAYNGCNNNASKAGVTRTATTSQLNSVLSQLKAEGILDYTTISDIATANGSKKAKCVAALAQHIQTQMESGRKVVLSDLWNELQKPPFGYYNTIACGILLGYVFSCYKNNKYTWTDDAQSPHVLAEATLSNMVTSMCSGKLTTDYLSAGSITWQNFSGYLAKIFNLDIGQLAEQTTGYHNVREAVTKSGAPFWALKYIPHTNWGSQENMKVAYQVIDNIQLFIVQEGDIESAMSNVLQLMQGRGKVRVSLQKAFNDKNTMAEALRTFMFEASSELKDIVNKLTVYPEELSDKLHSLMQTAIYTWTEEQVKEKLTDITNEYKYLEVLGNVMGTVYHNADTAKKDLANLFKFLRISLVAIEQLNKEWYPALKVLHDIANDGLMASDADTRLNNIEILNKYGLAAKDCLCDGKSILADILFIKNIDYTLEELDSIYNGLKDTNCHVSLAQFERELKIQVGKISAARNKLVLQETWRSITGEEDVKAWCNRYGVPLLWVIPKELSKAFLTLIDVQKKNHTVDSDVVISINALRSMDQALLNDPKKIEDSFISVVGNEYLDIWTTNRAEIITKTKLRIGNDMSTWAARDLTVLQKELKRAQQDKAKKEKLDGTKNKVRTMNEQLLRERIAVFLDLHPEYCDNFSD